MFWELSLATAPQLVLTTVSRHSAEHRNCASRIHVALRHPTIFLAAWMAASHIGRSNEPHYSSFLSGLTAVAPFTEDKFHAVGSLCSVGVVARVGRLQQCNRSNLQLDMFRPLIIRNSLSFYASGCHIQRATCARLGPCKRLEYRPIQERTRRRSTSQCRTSEMRLALFSTPERALQDQTRNT